jgi:RNA polymerase sigma-70 factor (ECF subfamily)
MMARGLLGASGGDAAMTSADADRASSFGRLADENLDANYRIASSILGDPVESQDAVHDAIVVAWQRWASLRDPTRFEAWFRKIVVNECRARLRRASRRRTTDIATQQGLATPDVSSAIADRVRLEQAVGRLEPDDQLLLALRYNHDLKLVDIGGALEIPTGTVKSRLNAAHARLRYMLEPSEGTPR